MDLKYEWQRYGSLRKGGQLSFSLLITCTRWFRSEKVAFRLVDGSGQIAPKDGYVELKAGQAVHIDYDTYDWDWCNGDMIIIFDSKGREYDRQVFNMRTYAPGECPECHGSHQCSACRGTGRITDRMHMVSTCPRCLGTGLCQTCYMPVRTLRPGNGPFDAGVAGTNPNVEMSRERKIEALRRRIYELRQNIERIEWEERTDRMRDATHGIDPSLTTLRMSRSTLKYTYQKQLIELQSELDQLERRGY